MKKLDDKQIEKIEKLIEVRKDLQRDYDRIVQRVKEVDKEIEKLNGNGETEESPESGEKFLPIERSMGQASGENVEFIDAIKKAFEKGGARPGALSSVLVMGNRVNGSAFSVIVGRKGSLLHGIVAACVNDRDTLEILKQGLTLSILRSKF